MSVRPEVRDRYLREHQADPVEAWLGCVPARFKGARIDQLEEGLQAAVRDWVDTNDPLCTLIFDGAYGVGKTYAAYAALLEAVRAGMRVEAWTAIDLLDALRGRNADEDDGAYKRLCRVPVLLLDDLGAEKMSEWTQERLVGLVDARWREALRLIVTTNSTEEMEAKVGPRAYDRLADESCSLSLSVKGRSRRRPGAQPGGAKPGGAKPRPAGLDEAANF